MEGKKKKQINKTETEKNRNYLEKINQNKNINKPNRMKSTQFIMQTETNPKQHRIRFDPIKQIIMINHSR